MVSNFLSFFAYYHDIKFLRKILFYNLKSAVKKNIFRLSIFLLKSSFNMCFLFEIIYDVDPISRFLKPTSSVMSKSEFIAWRRAET